MQEWRDSSPRGNQERKHQSPRSVDTVRWRSQIAWQRRPSTASLGHVPDEPESASKDAVVHWRGQIQGHATVVQTKWRPDLSAVTMRPEARLFINQEVIFGVISRSNSQYNIKVLDGNRCSAGFGTVSHSQPASPSAYQVNQRLLTDYQALQIIYRHWRSDPSSSHQWKRAGPWQHWIDHQQWSFHGLWKVSRCFSRRFTGIKSSFWIFLSFFFSSMKWKDKHFVTVKRLHGNTVEGGCVDLLIEELQILR